MLTFPRLVAEANRTACGYEADADAITLLDRAALRHDARPALRTAAAEGPGQSGTAGEWLTHGELAAISSRMADVLVAHGVRRGTPVGLLIDHRPESVAALIAVARAGAYYVPLDPRWPDQRVAEVMTSLGIATLIAAPAFDRRVYEFATGLPYLERVFRISQPARETTDPLRRLAEITEVWDGIAASDDPSVAAGFNLDRGGHRFTGGEVHQYAAHVARLVLSHYQPGTAVAEIGAGNGLIASELAPYVSQVLATDVSAVAMERLARRASELNIPIETSVGPAHEVAPKLSAACPSVILLASVVQYFPDLGYLRSVLHELLCALPPGTVVVIADVIDPASGQFPGAIRIPAAWWREFAEGYPGTGHQIVGRQPGDLPGPLAERYDVLLTVGSRCQAAVVSPRAGSPEAPLPLDSAPGTDIEPSPFRPLPSRPDELLYTITTSGSTGVPKAVAVSHRSVVNLVDWFNRRHSVGPDDVMLQVAAFTFDLSVYDVFGVLAAGGSIVLLPDNELGEPDRLLNAIADHKITLWNSAPAAFTAVLAFLGRDSAVYPSMRRVFLSGDWVPLATYQDVARAFPGATLVALGGATEACVWSNDFVVRGVDPEWKSIPYGLPMQNARYYVLRDDGTPCDLDEPGDLYIAGDCVAVGYLNDPRLTAERFVPDPWSLRPGTRMYRTGDRVRWTSHGWMEFLGRLDHQVKIRGYRIELGEIEHVASGMPGVTEAIAARIGQADDADLGLSVRAGETITEAAVREYLRGALPSYMQPSRIRVLSSFPVSATGKVDRAALAASLAVNNAPRRVKILAAGSGL
ncbi:MAG TPA: amino acid adenylation domain-containing protein [Streptosporangiaceae bacterium]